MEQYGARESKMHDRVAETSISAQKITDERKGPFRSVNNISFTRKCSDYNHFYLANSAYKGTDEGYTNSFKTLRFYQNEGASYRDELLKEVAIQES